MALYIGGTKVGANGVYVGGTKASAVYLGSTKAWPDNITPIALEYTANATYTVPEGAQYVDIVILGAGGGGDSGGAGMRVGKGGGAGQWFAETQGTYGGMQIGIYPGVGGKGGYGTITGTAPTAGYQSYVNTPGIQRSAAGGVAGNLAGASTVQAGAAPSPTSYTFNGRTYAAGAGGAGGNPGKTGGVGAGGGGGNGVISGFVTGGDGGPGKIWLYIY